MTPSPVVVAGRPAAPTRLIAATALTGMACALVWKLLIFLDWAHWAVLDPHELDYGEGIVWQQMRMIVEGRGYAPLGTFPAIVFHYPPVYHLLTWVVASVSGADDLTAGRALAVFGTLTTATFLGVIAGLATVGSSRAARWTCGATAALVSLTCFPVAIWSVLMRVDMVAAALTLGGFWLAMAALRRPALIYPAAIAFVCAVFTKQTMVAAPGAAFLVLLFLRPAVAVRGIAACVLLGLSVLAVMSLATHGQFMRHIFGYNINRFSFERLKTMKILALSHLMYLQLGVVGVWLSSRRIAREIGPGSLTDLRRRLGADVGTSRGLMAVAYLVTTTCLLILAGKVGSSVNYYIEWFLAVGVFVGVAARPAADAIFPTTGFDAPGGARFSPLVLLPALVAVGALLTPSLEKNDEIKNAADERELTTLTRWIGEANLPVISDNMVILRKAGKEVVLEPAIVAELGSTGVYDERALTRLIRDRRFAFFVTSGERGDALFDTRYNPPVAAAIYEAYPRVVKMAGLTVHLPVAAPPPALP
jgi:hypothetical protein